MQEPTASTALNLDDYPPFEEEEERTMVRPAGKSANKTIPFGSTLSARPLRVRYDLAGKVQMTAVDGAAVPMEQLPDWERRELFRHLRFMSSLGAL